MSRCMSIIHDAVLKYHNTYIDWKCGKRCESVEALPSEYASVLEALNIGGAAGKFEQSYRMTIEQERQMILSVLSKDKIRVHKVLKEIYAPLMNKKAHDTEIALLSGDMLTLAVKLFKENNIPFRTQDNHEILNSDVEKTYLYFNDLFISLINSINSTGKYSKAVHAIISYIDQHYQEDISLSVLSDHCSMNPSYISTVFKKETGINLVQYINRMRIYYVCKCMIMDEVSPTLIYENAGFRNYNNFFNLFKLITGMSPSQFKKEATIEWIAKFNPMEG